MTWELLIRYWESNNPYRPGVMERDFQEVEAKYSVLVPSEFRALYSMTDGTFVDGEPGTDHKGYAFWPLADIRPDNEHRWAFIFADFREESWWYAVACAKNKEASAGPFTYSVMRPASHCP